MILYWESDPPPAPKVESPKVAAPPVHDDEVLAEDAAFNAKLEEAKVAVEATVDFLEDLLKQKPKRKRRVPAIIKPEVK